MTYGSTFLFDDDVDKHRNKSQITGFFVFLFKAAYAKKSSGSLYICPTIRHLQHIPKKIISDL